MKDKLGDLIPWVEKLMATLARVDPNQDSEEIKRRSELARFVSRLELPAHPNSVFYSLLEDIGKRSTTLSEKGKVARALDKSRDSGKVVRLVEELRQAILVYQVSVSCC